MPILQEQLNNSSNSAIGLASNEVVYGFKIKKALFLLHEGHFITLLDGHQKNDHSFANLFDKRLEFRVEISDVTTFVNAKAKIYYDSRHQSLLLNSNDKTYLRLNNEYHLLGKSSKKVSS